MASRQYLLVSEWAWDHFNTEFHTITLEEGSDEELETQLRDPKRRSFWERKLLEMAEQSNGCLMPSTPTLKQLFRVTGKLPREVGRDTKRLELTLKPVAEFGSKNRIIVESLPVPEPSS